MTPLLTKIERHLRATATPPSRFGREAAHDPRFVFDLRNGREPRRTTVTRVLAFMDTAPPGAASRQPSADQESAR